MIDYWRLLEMKTSLLARGYDRGKVEVAIQKDRAIPRNKALKQSNKSKKTKKLRDLIKVNQVLQCCSEHSF